jgi:hypothetical protein
MVDLSGTFRLQPPDVTAENFDGEYVILNLATGRYFALSPTGSVLLEGILAGFNLTDIAEVFAGGDERRARQARALVREMLARDRGYLDVARRQILMRRRAQSP